MLKALQNLANVLNKLGHHSLALGYANAALIIHPEAKKAAYAAALACSRLGCPMAALAFLYEVRAACCRQLLLRVLLICNSPRCA